MGAKRRHVAMETVYEDLAACFGKMEWASCACCLWLNSSVNALLFVTGPPPPPPPPPPPICNKRHSQHLAAAKESCVKTNMTFGYSKLNASGSTKGC